MKKVHLELLLGRRVYDKNGQVAGRLLGVQGVREGSACVVTEYQLGATALLVRLGITSALLFGLPFERKPSRVPWQLMDLSDPDRPRLTVSKEELQALSSAQ